MAENSGHVAERDRDPGPQRLSHGTQGRRIDPPRRPPFRVATASVEPCGYCRKTDHRAATCPRFLNLSVRARRQVAQERRLCFSCTGKHYSRECSAARPCPQCQGSHHLVLCANRNGSSSPNRRPGSPGLHTDGGSRERSSLHREHGQESGHRAAVTGGGIYTRPPRHDAGFRENDSPPHILTSSAPGEAEVQRTRGRRQSRRLSPPLAEQPRLNRDSPPPWAHRRTYVLPARHRVQGTRGSYAAEWDPLTHARVDHFSA